MLPTLRFNEKDLLLQMAEGNEFAFRQLFLTYHNKLYNYIFTLSQSKEFAEDTVHDVFLKLWTNRQALTGITHLNAYIYRMAHNHAINGFKRMAAQTIMLSEMQQNAVTEVADPADTLLWKEASKFLQQSVNRLTPQQKQVFVMSREQGMKHAEIASALNISLLTVKKHLADARKVLRQSLTANYGLGWIPLYCICQLLL
ncbi:MAG TPA: RNA polymerase sigma-70 factor [Chitinophagaceae bacterium]|nr:RNA polymerase sigma-70 factor [Chitinophagaceae bacterium]